MDFEDAKENIQPLATGRNATLLHASLHVESPEELLVQRRLLEKEIHAYEGDDPLEPWYEYVQWIEQSFPSGGKESGLQEVLMKCLSTFEREERYYQDRRMIKLYLKFMDGLKDATECYQQMFNAGIGTMVADFYISWALWYDMAGNARKADEIFRRGIACRAQPLEELKEAHMHFNYTVAQRMMYRDDEDMKASSNRELHERRAALSRLRGTRRKAEIGSIRTGAVVKSLAPGMVNLSSAEASTSQPSSKRANTLVRPHVYRDENVNPNRATVTLPVALAGASGQGGEAVDDEFTSPPATEESQSVVRSILSKARNQENLKEPGPWLKAAAAHNSHSKSSTVFGVKNKHELQFNIHEDPESKDEREETTPKSLYPPFESEDLVAKGIQLPPNFVAKNKPLPKWITPVTTDQADGPRTIPKYNKCMLYPRPNMEFTPEELKGYYWFKRRGISNKFTQERDEVWSTHDVNANVRMYPHFARSSNPQQRDKLDAFYAPEPKKMVVDYERIYDKDNETEYSLEELMAKKYKINVTIIGEDDMEETILAPTNNRRKSFFPSRRSVMPQGNRQTMYGVKRQSIMPVNRENKDEEEKDKSKVIDMVLEGEEGVEPVQSTKTEVTEGNPSETVHPQVQMQEVAPKYDSRGLNSPEAAIQKAAPTPPLAAADQHKNFKFFEIYEDPTQTNTPTSSCPVDTNAAASVARPFHKNEESENPPLDFQFKTPAVLTTKSPPVMFSQANDENMPFSLTATQDAAGAAGGPHFFDVDETCSTQTFNTFLKSQFISTPKIIQKAAARTVLGDVVPVTPISSVSEFAPITTKKLNKLESIYMQDKAQTSPVNEIPMEITGEPANAAAASAEVIANEDYSPMGGRQLSTILETSEQGTTQGTHTTGASTKSTFSSPEVDVGAEGGGQQTNTRHGVIAAHRELETLEENSNEVSQSSPMPEPAITAVATTASSNVDFLISKMNIKGDNECEPSKMAEEKSKVPLDPYLLEKPFAIFEDETHEALGKQAGNFTHWEQKEETATGYLVRSVRFQEDKTETMPKMFKDAKAQGFGVHFQDDKTETIQNILLPSSVDTKPLHFESEPTETLPRIDLPSLKPLKDYSFDECLLKSPEKGAKVLFQSKEVTNIKHSPLHIKGNNVNMPSFDDSMAEFLKSPVRENKVMGPIAKARTINDDFKSPLVSESKRLCQKPTPESAPKGDLRSLTSLIKKEEKSNNSPFIKLLQTKHSDGVVQKLHDSFVPDFSFGTETQPQGKTPFAEKEKRKSKLQDSFVPDFSYVAETQPQPMAASVPATTEENVKTKSSYPEGSQQIAKANSSGAKSDNSEKMKSKLLDSFLPDVSYMPETQQQPLVETIMPESGKGKSRLLDSLLPESPYPPEAPFKKVDSVLPPKAHDPRSSLARAQAETQTMKDSKNLMDTFMKDFCTVKESSATSLLQFSQNKSGLKYPNESEQLINPKDLKKGTPIKAAASASLNLNLLTEVSATKQASNALTPAKGGLRKSFLESFSLTNTEPQIFAPNMSSIKNSTLLPRPKESAKSQIETSKAKEVSMEFRVPAVPPMQASSTANTKNNAQNHAVTEGNRNIDEVIEIIHDDDENNAVGDEELSIYYKKTPKTPEVHVIKGWSDFSSSNEPAERNDYLHTEFDPTHQIVDNICMDPNVNPFSTELIAAFLENIEFSTYMEGLRTCQLVRNVPRLQPHTRIKVKDVEFEVTKVIGTGAYGAVFSGKAIGSNKTYAFKQERPPNYWEYYICLEIQSRLTSDELLPAFMSVDYALVGNNATILISEFSPYGSLIAVCNKVKKHTLKNVDELVVMHLACELLELVDHLHAMMIIHADIKADNLLLMKLLTYPSKERALQLIDFGVSIDMHLFKPDKTFKYIHSDNAFNCIEMRENRPWTYQLDLYGLAGVIHVLLFGKYMEIEKKPNGTWMPKTRFPRYFHRELWETIFKTLLNVPNCHSMPNLQQLRTLLKEELADKENYLIRKISDFNRSVQS